VSLLRYVVKRLLQSIPLIVFAMVLTFVIIQSAPGDPATYLLSGFEYAPAGFVEMKRHELGLDQPIYVRFLIYLKDFCTLNFGYSYTRRTPVIDELSGRLVNTLLLTATAMVIQVVGGAILGLIAARRAYSLTDTVTSVMSLLLWSMPPFWRGIIAIIVFGLFIPIFPVGGMSSPGVTGIQAIPDIAWHLFLPATVLGLGGLGLYTRMTRASILEVLHQDYILTAWSKGCDERRVLTRHAFRNALLPLVTLIALGMGTLFMGAVLTEIVFGWPGMGTLIYESVTARDYAMVQVAFTFVTITVVLSNLLADIVYALVDPRIRYT
jgi:peptide/nickel transport system permease protein